MTDSTAITGSNEGAGEAGTDEFMQAFPQTELLSSLFFDATCDAAIIINSAGLIVHLNTQTEKLFGYRRDELLNQPVELLLPEEMRTRHAGYRRRYFENPQPRPMGSNFVAVGRRKDGSEVPIEIALSPLPAAGGLYVASVVRDISRQQQLENKLRQHARDLEDADRHKDEFLTTLAHELHSPLAAVTYSAELLRRPDLAAADREKAARIVMDEAAYIRRLIDDLGELSLMRRGEFLVRNVPTDIGKIARFAVETVRPLFEQRQHVLEVALTPAPTRVNGDAARLTQILTNLLNNAARYTPNRGRIRLSIEQQDAATVLIMVKDNGIGMPTDMLTRVFDLFTRLDAARDKYRGGLGIGLAYVRRLTELQGGSVQAFSDGEGCGSEFVVRLPLARRANAAVSPRPPAAHRMAAEPTAIPAVQPATASGAQPPGC